MLDQVRVGTSSSAVQLLLPIAALIVFFLTLQPYEINLLVASIFTRVAAASYPTFEWLFRTDSQERNVYTILRKVC
jgi:hypothetical protein